MSAERIIEKVIFWGVDGRKAAGAAAEIAKRLRDAGIDLDHTYEPVEREDRCALYKAVITVHYSLTDPYPDNPTWSPWTRFVKPALARSHFLTKPVFVRRPLEGS